MSWSFKANEVGVGKKGSLFPVSETLAGAARQACLGYVQPAAAASIGNALELLSVWLVSICAAGERACMALDLWLTAALPFDMLVTMREHLVLLGSSLVPLQSRS